MSRNRKKGVWLGSMRDHAKLYQAILDGDKVVDIHARKTTQGSMDECWPWTGYRDRDGYGQIYFSGAGYASHRVAFMKHYRVNAEGFCVLHKCDNPTCQNPNHLFLGTAGENNTDRNNKGRTKVGSAKLTPSKVREIRAIYASGAMGCYRLAKKFGMAKSTILALLHRRNWRHVE